LKVQSGDSNL